MLIIGFSYDPKKEIIVASDASDYGIGTMLPHEFEDGVTKPIAHDSGEYSFDKPTINHYCRFLGRKKVFLPILQIGYKDGV